MSTKASLKDINFAKMILQDPDSQEQKVRAILNTFICVLLLIMLNDIMFYGLEKTLALASASAILASLHLYLNSDTSRIVAGMMLWTMQLFTSYMAWSNDGLYDTALLAFPCIMMFAYILGRWTMMLPLLCFMLCTFYFLAYAKTSGLITNGLHGYGSLWAKANTLSIILIIYSVGIKLVSKQIRALVKHLTDVLNRYYAVERESENRLKKDILTGLPNEIVCQDNLELMLSENRLGKEIVGIITLDIKNFRQINTSLGHEVGDRVTLLISERLRTLVDDQNSLYRTSGNEFVLLAKANDYEDISEFAHLVLSAVNRPFQIEGYEMALEAHMGVSIAPFDGRTYSILRQKSHNALSHAKEQEEGALRFFEHDMEAKIRDRMKLVQDLKISLDKQNFELYYQPKIDLSNGKISGAEALIRWNKDGKEMILPDRFIHIAEESGILTELGKWTLETACAACKDWHLAGHTQMRIAVNLSPVQFKRGNLPKIVEQALLKSGLAPSALELEITESLCMDENEDVKAQFAQLASMGTTIAIDDFGTGYSNLNYLSRFHASTLKIDKSFVRNMLNEAQQQHIVHAVISMAKSMNMRCVAEGVEDLATARKLKAMDCDAGQGFYWSRPLPLVLFSSLLNKHASSKDNSEIKALPKANIFNLIQR